MGVWCRLVLVALIGIVGVGVSLCNNGPNPVNNTHEALHGSQEREASPRFAASTPFEAGQKISSLESTDKSRSQVPEGASNGHRILLLEKRVKHLEAIIRRQLHAQATNDDVEAGSPEDVETQNHYSFQTEERALETQTTMEREFLAQQIDTEWSYDTENKIHDSLGPALVEKGLLANVECRYSMCRIETDPVADSVEQPSFASLTSALWKESLHFPKGISLRKEDGGMIFYLVSEGFELRD